MSAIHAVEWDNEPYLQSNLNAVMPPLSRVYFDRKSQSKFLASLQPRDQTDAPLGTSSKDRYWYIGKGSPPLRQGGAIFLGRSPKRPARRFNWEVRESRPPFDARPTRVHRFQRVKKRRERFVSTSPYSTKLPPVITGDALRSGPPKTPPAPKPVGSSEAPPLPTFDDEVALRMRVKLGGPASKVMKKRRKRKAKSRRKQDPYDLTLGQLLRRGRAAKRRS